MDRQRAPTQTACSGRIKMGSNRDSVVIVMGSRWVMDGVKERDVRPAIFGRDHDLDLRGCLR